MNIDEVIAYHTARANGERPISTSDWNKEAAEVLAAQRDENVKLTHLLGSHANGHLCTCKPLPRHSPWEPPDWEQDPWCPTHPNMSIVQAEYNRLRQGFVVLARQTGDEPGSEGYAQAVLDGADTSSGSMII
jgi:hypothetical protein